METSLAGVATATAEGDFVAARIRSIFTHHSLPQQSMKGTATHDMIYLLILTEGTKHIMASIIHMYVDILYVFCLQTRYENLLLDKD